MNNSQTGDRSAVYRVADLVGVVADGQTYKNLLYLFLAFPLGLLYYVVLMIGFSLGVGLSILVVGLGILFVTVVGLRWIASFERRLANALLGTDIATPDDVERADEGLVEAAKSYLGAPSTWRGLGFVVLKFWIGILSFVLLVTFLGTAVELLLLPLFPDGVLNIQVMGWEIAPTVQSVTHQAVAVPAGAVLGLFALHILNAFAGANASIATALLGPEQSDE
ncbi:MAG: hypothetical protein ACI8XM_002035 [Haloarculaceae archaeon]|jgi:hypothetical protein